MERARRIWEDERLPALSPKTPWFGYPLGPWPAEWEEEADVAVKGRYYALRLSVDDALQGH